MTKAKWKKKIKEQMEQMGIYQTAFNPTILALAEILEQRDKAFEDFTANGGEMIVTNTSDRGAKNMRKNPRLQAWQDLNAQALLFWRDLGLTPSGLKKISDMTAKKEKDNSVLTEALKKLCG